MTSARMRSPRNCESCAAAPTATAPGCASASGKSVTFGSIPAMASLTERAAAAVTTPAPQRDAARQAISSAPG